MRLDYPANVKIVKVPCTGRIDVLYILKAFEQGVDGVFVAGCMEGECHFLTGNIRARKRVAYLKHHLAALGINPQRLEMYNLSAAMGARFVEIAREMTDRVQALGPSPIKQGSGREWQLEQKEGEES
jgi:F420-non-reducing hydrogenase iron-sulfur subunit